MKVNFYMVVLKERGRERERRKCSRVEAAFCLHVFVSSKRG